MLCSPNAATPPRTESRSECEHLVREGLSRRVQEGWFVGLAPYGYRNVRKDGRGVIEIDPEAAANVNRIFHLYAYLPLIEPADRRQ